MFGRTGRRWVDFAGSMRRWSLRDSSKTDSFGGLWGGKLDFVVLNLLLQFLRIIKELEDIAQAKGDHRVNKSSDVLIVQ
jgi:hypothetical protein